MRDVGPNRARAIPESEISGAKALINLCAQTDPDQEQRRFDERLRALIIPRDEDEALREPMLFMKRNNIDRISLFICE
jgi:hypothetical protein